MYHEITVLITNLIFPSVGGSWEFNIDGITVFASHAHFESGQISRNIRTERVGIAASVLTNPGSVEGKSGFDSHEYIFWDIDESRTCANRVCLS